MVTLAEESVACGTDTVLSTYSSPTSKEAMIQNYRDREVGEPSTWLVGENWIINTPKSDIPSLATYLGGQPDRSLAWRHRRCCLRHLRQPRCIGPTPTTEQIYLPHAAVTCIANDDPTPPIRVARNTR